MILFCEGRANPNLNFDPFYIFLIVNIIYHFSLYPNGAFSDRRTRHDAYLIVNTVRILLQITVGDEIYIFNIYILIYIYIYSNIYIFIFIYLYVKPDVTLAFPFIHSVIPLLTKILILSQTYYLVSKYASYESSCADNAYETYSGIAIPHGGP